MANEGISIPSSGGGLMRYNEDTGSKYSIKPTHVVAATVAIIVLFIILKVMGV